MTRSKAGVFLRSFSVYMALSLLSTALLLAALAGMELALSFAIIAFGPGHIYWIRYLFCDSAGFALASAGTAMAQYLMAGLLAHSGLDRRLLAAMVFAASLFCGLFFWRWTLRSSLGDYGVPGLPVAVSALIGGLAGLFRKQAANPRASALFKWSLPYAGDLFSAGADPGSFQLIPRHQKSFTCNERPATGRTGGILSRHAAHVAAVHVA
jgi:hypothetical protein